MADHGDVAPVILQEGLFRERQAPRVDLNHQISVPLVGPPLLVQMEAEGPGLAQRLPNSWAVVPTSHTK